MWWAACCLLLIVACSHSAAPVLAIQDNEIDLYIRAKTTIVQENPKEACGHFLKLSQSPTFSLKDVAHVQALNVCPTEQVKDSLQRPVPDWLKKDERNAQLKHQATDTEKALLIIETPQYFLSRDRVLTYQEALSDSEISSDSRKRIQDALYAIAPRFNPKPEPKDVFRVSKDLRSVRDFEKARKLLSAVAKDKKQTIENRMMALKEIYQTYKIQRHLKKQYLDSAKQWAELIKPGTPEFKKHIALFAEANYTRLRTLWTESGTEEPLKIIDKLEKQLSGMYPRHDLFWLRAKMFEEKNDAPNAIVNFEKALKEPNIGLRDQEKVLWSLAWLQLKQKDFSGAKTHLSAAVALKDVSPFAKFKYTFWLAEAELRNNLVDESHKLFNQLTQDDTFGFYGIMAHHRLQKSFPALNSAPSEVPITLLTEEDRKIFNALVSSRETDLASQFLSFTFISKKRVLDLSQDEAEQLFQLLAKAKNYKMVFDIFNQIPFDQQRKILSHHPEILFPRPYNDVVEAAAAKSAIEAELIYSIMRQESSFDAQARSPMDAMGLLQLLPEVAQRIAKRLQIPYNSYDDLNDAATNISIGADLLKTQQKRFDDKFILYVASYNASDSAVKQWQSRHQGDPMEFIESIPYEETKSYVKLVMRNYIIYKKLRFGEDFKTFPQHLLSL